MDLVAQRELKFSPSGFVIAKGGTMRPATDEQVAKYRTHDVGKLYEYYTQKYDMVLIDLDGTNVAWIYPSDYDPKRPLKKYLSKTKVEAEKHDLAEKIRTLYGHPMAEVTVSRDYGNDPKYWIGKKYGGGYLAKVEIPGEASHTAIGRTELRALRKLHREMTRGA
jgi:hypothetical protein